MFEWLWGVATAVKEGLCYVSTGIPVEAVHKTADLVGASVQTVANLVEKAATVGKAIFCGTGA